MKSRKLLIFLAKLMNKTKEDNIFALSAQLSYYFILSIFPSMILIISMLCNYSSFIYNFLDSISTILPSHVYGLTYDFLNYSTSSCSKPYISFSMLLILWSASSSSSTIIKAINLAYGFNTKKNYLSLRFRGIFFILALIFSMQIIFAAIIAGRSILLFVKKLSIFNGYTFLLIDLLRFSFGFFLIFLVILAAYKYLPYERVKFSYAFPGAIFAALSCLVGSYLYSLYVSAKILYINSIYGNLAGLFVFIIWIYILSVIFLVGAEVNYFIIKEK